MCVSVCWVRDLNIGVLMLSIINLQVAQNHHAHYLLGRVWMVVVNMARYADGFSQVAVKYCFVGANQPSKHPSKHPNGHVNNALNACLVCMFSPFLEQCSRYHAHTHTHTHIDNMGLGQPASRENVLLKQITFLINYHCFRRVTIIAVVVGQAVPIETHPN